MAKECRAKLVPLEWRCLCEMHLPLHDCPAAISNSSRFVLALLLVTVSAAVVCGKTNAAPAIPASEVEVASVVQKDVPIFSEWVATLDGYVNAQIQPQVTGYIIRQTYKEGSFVRKGQLLFQIDPRPFQALLDQANAQLAQTQVQLAKTQMDVDRDTPLAQARAIAQSQLDKDIQANRAGAAAVKAAPLVAYRKTREFSIQEELLFESAQDAARLSHMRYSGGVTGYLEVLTNKTNAFSAELAVVEARQNELLELVQLYEALGGGWQP